MNVKIVLRFRIFLGLERAHIEPIRNDVDYEIGYRYS